VIRESASVGVIWKCWSNISFRLDSAILLSASRRLPLYPKPSARFRGGWRWRWWWARELLVNGGNGGSGAEAPDRGSANTLPSLFSCLISPQPSSMSLVHPRPSPSSTSTNIPTGLPRPIADLARWRTALQNRAKCKTLKIRRLKFQFAMTVYRDYIHVFSLQSYICILSWDLF